MSDEIKKRPGSGAVISGWVCFGLATILALIPLPTFFVYIPLFLVALIMAIVALAQGRTANGLTLLLSTILGGPVIVLVAWIFGFAAWSVGANAVALSQMKDRQQSMTNSTSNNSSVYTGNQETNEPVLIPIVENPQQIRVDAIKKANADIVEKKDSLVKTKTLEFHRNLCAQGDAYGQFKMGIRYLTGDGVEKDENKARDLLAKSSAQGFKDATIALAKLHAK